MREMYSYGGLEPGGKTWGRIDRVHRSAAGNFPYGNGPDDVRINESDDSDEINDDAQWKKLCKLIEDRFGEPA